MPVVLLFCTVLIALTTLVHYEALRLLNTQLPTLQVPPRAKVLVVMFVSLTAHLVEIALYAAGIYILINHLSAGTLSGTEATFATCLYFSVEAFTSLGLGDVTPSGPVRFVAGIEALNGLLLIAWTASYAFLAMERFWTSPGGEARR